MVKKIIPAIVICVLMGGCSALKQAGFSDNKPIVPQNTASVPAEDPPSQKTSEVKFLDNISASSQNRVNETSSKFSKGSSNNDVNIPKANEQTSQGPAIENSEKNTNINGVENTSALQMKYAVLLNTDMEKIQNIKLFEYIDDWYGTRYCMGGTTKNCVDCSSFVQSLFAAVYGISLPRTSNYQFTATKRISTTDLREGDLLFFHTGRNRRGVTHVGIYLQNNKFVQASSSDGVKISDMYEPYYVQHLIGAGRVIKKELIADR